MPKLLCWNLGGAICSGSALETAISDSNPDLIALSEHSRLGEICLIGYREQTVFPARLRLFSRLNIVLSMVDVRPHFVILRLTGGLMTVAHLRSDLYNGHPMRDRELREMATAIYKNKTDNEWVVVAGDLNVPPYDPQLTSFESLHARQTFQDARQLTKVDGKHWPHLMALGFHHLGSVMSGSPPVETSGSFYFKGAQYDQLLHPLLDHALVSADLDHAQMKLLRHGAMDYTKGLGIVKKDRKLPDHLPLVVEW